ncbi:MAG: hypothetical protein NTW19_17735 [Planctomycetota bacterium]|nr:hypothetical protein [Planctomycetota bacterium]
MNPYLSFVVTTRNDDYGENQLHRTNVFLRALVHQWRKHRLDAELVVVEWNPPLDRPPITDAIEWPSDLPKDRVRVVRVSPNLHALLPNAGRMALFEWLGKNVGIRRARGRFILPTNPDLLFSDALMAFLASESLEPGAFYRIDRADVWETVPARLSVDEQLDFCAKGVYRVALREELFFVDYIGGRIVPRVTADRMIRLRAYLAKRGWPTDRVHCNAAGDFTLASREHWFAMRGYPELTTHSFADSFACVQAAAAGLREIVLDEPCRIYHQEHDRSEQARRPLTPMQGFIDRGNRMLDQRLPEVDNPPTWGMGNMPLPEQLIA